MQGVVFAALLAAAASAANEDKASDSASDNSRLGPGRNVWQRGDPASFGFDAAKLAAAAALIRERAAERYCLPVKYTYHIKMISTSTTSQHQDSRCGFAIFGRIPLSTFGGAGGPNQNTSLESRSTTSR